MKKKKTEKVIETIDVYDDDLMVNLGIRQPSYVIPSHLQADFKKTVEEKALLKKVRTKNTKFYSISSPERDIEDCYSKLIVTTKKRDNNVNTFSCKCWHHQIQQILNDFYPDYTKYYFNGKTIIKNVI